LSVSKNSFQVNIIIIHYMEQACKIFTDKAMVIGQLTMRVPIYLKNKLFTYENSN
jgi:hypothetical protein